MIDPSSCASLGELLADALVQWKRHDALIELDRNRTNHRLTYLDVRREAARVIAWLDRANVRPGDRVGLTMSNQSRWPIAATAILVRGAVLVPLDYKLSGDEQIALAGHAEIAALVTEGPLLARMRSLPDALPLLVSEPRPGDARGTDWATLEDAPFPTEPVPRTRDDVATIVYSSGTAGRAKGCVLTHDAYLEQLRALMELYPMEPRHRSFSVLPSNHAIDFMVGFLGPFACGAGVVHQRTLRPEFLVSTMRAERVTHVALVPALLAALERALDAAVDKRPSWQRAALDVLARTNLALTRERPDPSLSRTLLGGVHDALGGALELVFCGGALVDRRRAERLYGLGLPVVIGYGLTECCTVATLQDLRPFRADSVGRAVTGVELRVNAPGDDGVGEIWIRSRTVMREYWCDPELTSATITEGGWLRTGDLGRLDASMHLHLVGRSKNMIVTAGGKNVYPEDVEAAFDGAPVEELAVLASGYVWPRASRLEDEVLVAIVRSKERSVGPALLAELGRRNRRLPEHARLGAVLPWADAFPRTASMKVKREALAEALRAAASPDDLVRLARHGEPEAGSLRS